MAATKSTNPGNFANDRKRASQAGKMQGKDTNPGNFANRSDASAAGKKGGMKS